MILEGQVPGQEVVLGNGEPWQCLEQGPGYICILNAHLGCPVENGRDWGRKPIKEVGLKSPGER